MTLAYVDTSFLLAATSAHRSAAPLVARLRRFERRVSSNLLEAEFRSALSREGLHGEDLLSWVDWIYPVHPLTLEFTRVLSVGYLKGADLWHLACALSLVNQGEDVVFLTLDERQKAVARKLGFPT